MVASRATARDLSVAILTDCSRSTEAAIGDTSVIDTSRHALAALAAGIDTAGDRLGIWGFASLRRDRVFLTRAKSFAERGSAAFAPAITPASAPRCAMPRRCWPRRRPRGASSSS